MIRLSLLNCRGYVFHYRLQEERDRTRMRERERERERERKRVRKRTRERKIVTEIKQKGTVKERGI